MDVGTGDGLEPAATTKANKRSGENWRVQKLILKP